MAVRRAPRRRDKFFDSSINDLIDRDITQLSEMQRRPDLDIAPISSLWAE
jgi:hypothetical protein